MEMGRRRRCSTCHPHPPHAPVQRLAHAVEALAARASDNKVGREDLRANEVHRRDEGGSVRVEASDDRLDKPRAKPAAREYKRHVGGDGTRPQDPTQTHRFSYSAEDTMWPNVLGFISRSCIEAKPFS